MVVAEIGLVLGAAAISLPSAVIHAQSPVGAAAGAWSPSPSILQLAYIDSTIPPCEDFYQYALGGWYRRADRDPAVRARLTNVMIGGDNHRISQVLLDLLARARTLAASTPDPALRVLGDFYGSCLVDSTGTAVGGLGDSTRTRYCTHAVRQYLGPALAEVLLEQSWPAASRAQSRAFWTHMQAAAVALFQDAPALADDTKAELVERASTMDLMIKGELLDDDPIEALPLLDSLAAVHLARPYVPAYRTLRLAPRDFPHNRTQILAAGDTALPAALPDAVAPLLDHFLFAPETEAYTQAHDHISYGSGGTVSIGASMLVPPLLDGGGLDLGGYYGMLAPMGHEMSHGFVTQVAVAPMPLGEGSDRPNRDELRAPSPQPPAHVQFREALFPHQLQGLGHPFMDLLGIRLAYDAFTRAVQDTASAPLLGMRLEGYTPTQRFFLGVAQGWLTPFTVDTGDEGYHRGRTMANGALSAMPAFAQAFGCPANGPMTGAHAWYRGPSFSAALPPARRRAAYAEYGAERLWQDLARELFQAFPDAEPAAAVQPIVQHLGAEIQALADSLSTTTDSVAGKRRMRALVAQRVGAMRAALPAEQQGPFDARLRPWRSTDGERLEVPGVGP